MADTLKNPQETQIDLDKPDIKLAFDTIKAKKPTYNKLFNYYEGYHPLHYSASRLKKVFEKMDVYFSENWLAVVADAVIDRLVLSGFDVSKNDQAKKRLDELWRDYNIMLIAEDVHESTTIVSEAFVIAMKVEGDDGEELDIYFNDARMCHMFYEAGQPNKKRVAAKLYQDDDGYTRLTLYYADRFEHYRSRKAYKHGTLCPSHKFLEPDPDEPEEENPFDKIPVFHWMTSRTTRKRDLGPSEISMQDAINKLLTDMMVSSEFNSFVQRVIISRSDPGNMPNEAGTNWWLPAGDGDGQQTSVQELGGRDLSGYLNGIDKLATALAIISRTPKHYFFAQGGDPSGEALIALEAPLNKKVKKRQGRYGVEWQDFAQFLLELEGIQVEKSQIAPAWEPAETVQPKTSAEITKLDVDAGMPLKTSKRMQGWNETKIKQLSDDLKEKEKEMTGLGRNALDQIRNEDAKNNRPIGDDGGQE